MYTRCPECQTAFRVTARQLQQAAGRVRCGHCGAAFDALVNLSEEHPSGVFPAFAAHTDGNRESGEDAQPAAPVIEVSESEQESQEIVLETGSHELDDLHDPASEQAPTSDAPAARGDDGDRATGAGEDDDDYVPEIEDTGIEWVVLDDETGSHWAQGALAGSDADEQSGTGDEPATGDLEDTLSREASALLGDDPSLSSGSFWAEPLAEQPSDPLSDTATHLWQPPDDPGEWGTDAEDETLQEETNGDELPMLLPADAERADAEPGQTRKPREDFNRPEVAEHEAVTDFAVESDAGEEIHLYDDLDLGDDLEPGDDRKPDNDRVPGDASELIGSIASAADAEQEDQATPPPEPAPAPAPPPARPIPHELPSRPPSIDSLEGAESAVTSRRWLSMALALVLLAGVGAQSVHHFRDTLAIDPRTGPAVGWIYDTLGRPLYPAWPLEDYQIQAQDDALMAADRQLQIRATLTNRGARTLPPPLIRLTLLDRWGESLGSRMFQPGEYLPAQAPSRLLPGVQLDATLSVRAPPGELYGYRLDVCHRIDAGNVRCDAQTR